MAEFRDVIVIGAGLTGLAAARTLTSQSIDCLVLEKEAEVGGRVRSEKFEGCILDHGFQVVLPAYPSIRSLDLPIRMWPFSQASTCISAHGKSVVCDPIHNLKLFIASLGRSPASISDLFRMLQHMRARRFDLSTDRLLDVLGYADRIKDDFLRPFLSGVLLDPDLQSPSPLSSYFLERFFLGGASLVDGGIHNFPKALAKNLRIECSTEVSEHAGGRIVTKDGREYAAKVVVDTRPKAAGTRWLSTQCHYFLSTRAVDLERRIVLIGPTMPSSINHIANLTEVAPGYSPAGTALLSVTTRDSSFADVKKVQTELSAILELPDSQIDYLKSFRVDKALPFVPSLPQEFPEPPMPTLSSQTIFASDTLAYGSQHASLKMGQMAGQLAISKIDV